MLLLLFYLQLLLLVFHSWSAVCTEVRCLERERQALLDIKAGFVDDSGLLSSWGNEEEKRDCCRWERVSCSDQNGHVKMLHLQGDKFYTYRTLSGKISTSLMKLKHLRYLNLSLNNFEYSYIPEFFGSLRSLRYLNLSYSNFLGKIPYQLGSLSHLRHLDLSSNFLQGAIPSQLGNLSQLQYLNLNNNNLIGAIPYQIGNLSSLQKLFLGDNFGLKIHKENSGDAQWLSNLTSLTVLDLSWVPNLNSSLNWLQIMGKLHNIKELFLTGCSLSDHDLLFLYPSKLSFSSLAILDLSSNDFSARFLKYLGNICTLNTLILEDVNLRQNISTILHNLSGCASYTLQELNLDYNQITGSLSDVSKFPSLKSLHLFGNQLNGIAEGGIPKTCALNSLDLSHNRLSLELLLMTHRLIGCGSTLQELNLGQNKITGRLLDLSKFSSLKILYLNDNQLKGTLEIVTGSLSDVSKFPALKSLYLSGNQLNGIAKDGIFKTCFLNSLHLSGNMFNVELQFITQNLFGCRSTLQELDLSRNQITGGASDLSKFTSLKELDLSSNQLNGTLENFRLPPQLEILAISSNFIEGGIPESFAKICCLRLLYLSENKLSSELPAIIHNLFGCARSLEKLDLSSNQITSTMSDLSKFSSLEYLVLSNNQLNGKIPQGIIFPSQLEHLEIASNSKLKGVITDSHFANMSKLKYLDLSFNSLTLTFSPNWVPSFQLSQLYLRSCTNLSPDFPKWLQTQKKLLSLDISDCGISDVVPEWFWSRSSTLNSLNISYNNLTGTIPNSSIRYKLYPFISLASNQFEGSIPQFFQSAAYLDLSRNKFSSLGMFASAYGSADKLGILDLSNNQLSSQFPNCWNNFKSLTYLDMSNNNLSGKIPSSIESLVELKALILRNNILCGDLPTSLKNCTQLVMLDVEENRFSGKVPSWIGNAFKQLRMLSLRINHFSGSIPLDLCHLTSLHFLDLSLNSLTGEIPQCLKNLTAMSQKEEILPIVNYYVLKMAGGRVSAIPFDLYALLMWKGVEQKFKNTAFRLRSIDLSSNQLMGEIPTQITNLDGLVSLNLSRNNLKGEIPSEIGRLTSLEFLDLSTNHLCGKIPSSLAQIDRLTMLNLSNNQLSGKIPTSTQLQSFDASSFEKNLNLCGKPLEKECPEEKATQRPPEVEDKEYSIFSHPLYMSMALGFITGFWGIFGSIIVNRSWRYAYFRFLNNLTDAIFVMVAINVAKYRRWLNH